MLSVTYPEGSYAECRYAECCYAEFRYALGRYAKCRYAECRCAIRLYMSTRVERLVRTASRGLYSITF
jgi:hypothetical protein